MLFPSRIYILQGHWYFGDYRNVFLQNVGEDQKKSYHLCAEPLALCHVVNPILVIALRSEKGLISA